MGRFIVSRSAAGDRFMLQSESGRTLAVSKNYAGLDACKKGICSLMRDAPVAPVVNRTKGERGSNPKFELIATAEGGLCYALLAANGKRVLSSAPFADQKSCLRAISILRREVVGAEVVFARPAGLVPLTVPDTAPNAIPPAVQGNMLSDPLPAGMEETPAPRVPAAAPPAAGEPPREARAPSTPSVKKSPTSARTATRTARGVRRTARPAGVGIRPRDVADRIREISKNRGKQTKPKGFFDQFFKK